MLRNGFSLPVEDAAGIVPVEAGIDRVADVHVVQQLAVVVDFPCQLLGQQRCWQ